MYYVAQDKGGRPYMEDTHSVVKDLIPGIDYYAIFDGHGGDQVSIYLKDNFDKLLKQHLEGNAEIPDAIYKTFKDIVTSIPKEISIHTGSTAIICIKKVDIIYIANCGDCRAIIDENGKAVQISEDHKPHYEVERINASGGFITNYPGDVPRVNGNLAVSRSVGDFYLFPHVTWLPEIYQVVCKPFNKHLVMASDGVWDVMSNQDIINIINIQGDFNKVCEHIIIHSRIRGSEDNITVIIIGTS